MPTTDTFVWEKNVLGEHIVYPSHPVIVACMVMDRYQNLAHACQRTKDCPHGFRKAATDQFIPGSGCAVSMGLRVLELSLKDMTEYAFALARDYIENYRRQSPMNDADADKAIAQFEKVKERFLDHVAVWGTPDMPESPYRLKDEVSKCA